jgi:hypothetical protein
LSDPHFLGEINVAVVAGVGSDDDLVAVHEFYLLDQAGVKYFAAEVEIGQIQRVLLNTVEMQHVLHPDCNDE